jgi:glycosyltransferase involved in cell wall biosynthesis
MPAAFESFSFDKYDLVISVTSESAKGIITKPGTKHICYCLTPTRYLWSGYEEYFGNKVFKALSRPAVESLRIWDKIASHRPDTLVAISKEVQERIKRYYGKDSVVIYPPLTLSEKQKTKNKKQKDTGEYFLVVSRFVSYKRIDLAIQACNELKLPLKIVGSGGEEERLKAMAGPTIEFVGKVTDEELADYYSNCRALLFPGVEDFGLAVVEAQHFGRPVIAFRAGGALETILAGKTGLFFDAQTKESLMSALQNFDTFNFDKNMLAQQAKKFSLERFKKDFKSIVYQGI